ncbi:hypothetical protein RE0356_28870 [Prescottella equi]|nr:hypothetical protein RE0356_28870 [Prescottella equi]
MHLHAYLLDVLAVRREHVVADGPALGFPVDEHTGGMGLHVRSGSGVRRHHEGIDDEPVEGPPSGLPVEQHLGVERRHRRPLWEDEFRPGDTRRDEDGHLAREIGSAGIEEAGAGRHRDLDVDPRRAGTDLGERDDDEHLVGIGRHLRPSGITVVTRGVDPQRRQIQGDDECGDQRPEQAGPSAGERDDGHPRNIPSGRHFGR